MLTRSLAALAAAGALLASPAIAATNSQVIAKGEAKLAHTLEGYTAGEPVRCLPFSRIYSTQIIDGTAILYKSGRRIYVNRPEIGASSLRNDQILVTKMFGSQLCDIDTVNLVDRNSRFWNGFVGLGEFVPYTKAEKHD
ncbi:hypothetical protein [Sphingomonas sp. ID0503]|uniref:hypothetical protein n=1 Tax=Sphingomonas sp. ID0503 TaxID=3399691 RepID=UPI003AFB4BFF